MSFIDGLTITIIIKLIFINIILSGDNAVVIAMASRNVPMEQRKKATFWGIFLAIALRIVFAGLLLSVLDKPYLHLIGGLLLVWISISLLIPSDSNHKEGGNSIWSAVRTILIADTAMSLDNILALVAAANGSLLGVAIGVISSIPFILFGSQLTIKALDKFPIISYIGSGILAWTAGEMIIEDAVTKKFLTNSFHSFVPTIITVLVVIIGFIISKVKKK